MKYVEIGGYVNIDEKLYQCKITNENDGCEGCTFNDPERDTCPVDEDLACLASERTDDTEVIFKEVHDIDLEIGDVIQLDGFYYMAIPNTTGLCHECEFYNPDNLTRSACLAALAFKCAEPGKGFVFAAARFSND